MTRYHPILVVLHWLMALMILMALAAGGLLLSNMPNDDPEKVAGLGAHMAFGMAIGVLLMLRLFVRVGSTKPPQATTGAPILDRIGVWTHWGFYLLIALVVASGLGTALSTGLFPIVFGGSGEPLPDSLQTVPPRIAHGIVAPLLALLIVLHLAAALYHQFILKDGLMSRMWFGRRRPDV